MKSTNIFIGIDPGTETGLAVWDSSFGELVSVDSFKIHKAMQIVLNYKSSAGALGPIKVRVEDARLRKWFGKASAEKLQGVGSVKRDCSIWEDFLTDNGIDFEMVPPKFNMTKLKAEPFHKITGYKKQTNEHGRDAAMLVFKK